MAKTGVTNSKTDEMNKAQILYYLKNTTGVVIGQHLGYDIDSIESPTWPWNYTHVYTDLVALTGKCPAMVAGQYGEEGNSTALGIHRMNTLLISHWIAGDLVQIEYVPKNPWTGGDPSDPYRTTLQDLLIPGTAHNAWIAELNLAHAGLEELRNAGIVVFWRPFPEMTYNGHAWWDAGNDWWLGGRSTTIAGFVALWRDMYARFADLPNLIWVYGAANQDYCLPIDDMWPGDDVVDVGGFSMYQPAVLGDPFTKLALHNTIVAFTEFGRVPRDGTCDLLERLAVLNAYPQVKYVLHWHSWDALTGLAAIVDQVNPIPYMNNVRAITRDKLSGYIPPTTPTATISVSPLSLIGWWQTFTLTWITTNATTAKIDRGIGNVALSGCKTIRPWRRGMFKYTITATAVDGTTVRASVTVTVK